MAVEIIFIILDVNHIIFMVYALPNVGVVKCEWWCLGQRHLVAIKCGGFSVEGKIQDYGPY